MPDELIQKAERSTGLIQAPLSVLRGEDCGAPPDRKEFWNSAIQERAVSIERSQRVSGEDLNTFVGSPPYNGGVTKTIYAQRYIGPKCRELLAKTNAGTPLEDWEKKLLNDLREQCQCRNSPHDFAHDGERCEECGEFISNVLQQS